MGIHSVDLNNINLDNANFYKDDPRTIIHVRILVCHNKLKLCKASKKRNKQRINACSMTCNKTMRLVLHTRI